MLHKCSVPTKRGNQCLIWADRNHDGVWYCHTHDPHGVYQRQMRELRGEKELEPLMAVPCFWDPPSAA